MNNNFLRIVELIPEKLHHLIWKDETRDTFVLTKHCEIHRYNKEYCRMICWNRTSFKKFSKAGLIQDEDFTDDGLFMGFFINENLPKILNFGIHFRRPAINGKWLQDKRERLAHDIRTYEGKSLCKPAYIEKFYQKLSPQIKSRIFAHIKPPEERKVLQEELL